MKSKAKGLVGDLDCKTNYVCISGGGECEGINPTITVKVDLNKKDKDGDSLAKEEETDDLQPLNAEQIRRLLKHDERLLFFDVGHDDTTLLVVRPAGQAIAGMTLRWPDGSALDLDSLRATVSGLH